MVIVLKQLATQYGYEPYPLRQILREKFGTRKNRRWSWDTDDPELKLIRKFLDGRSKSSAKSATT